MSRKHFYFAVWFSLLLFQNPFIDSLGSFECYEEYHSCYLISDTGVPWHEASCSCRHHGGSLVKFDTDQEQRFVLDKVNATNQWYWIGASDLSEEGRFVWEDGLDAVHVDWWKGKPNNLDGNDCVLIFQYYAISSNYFALKTLLAEDHRCSDNAHFICERDIAGSSRERYFKAITSSQDVIYNDHVIREHPGMSKLQCGKLYMRECAFSFGYNQNRSDCILYDDYYIRLTGTTLTKPGYLIYN